MFLNSFNEAAISMINMFIETSSQYNDDCDAPGVEKYEHHEDNDMSHEYKQRMTMTICVLGVHPWHFDKVHTKMLPIGTMNDANINDYMKN